MELRREADVQQLCEVKEEVPPQEEPEPPHIKEEQEELWSSQEGEQLQGLEEADITKFPFTPVPVKSEDDEEEPQSSQGEDCGGPGPHRNPDPELDRNPDPEPETDDETSDSSEAATEKDWKDRGRPFGCSLCAKTFQHRGNLNMHMRTHTGLRPYSCSLCNKSFTQKPGLDYHLKVHTGEKPFSCSICGKRFRLKGAVTSHMATHTGVKPYSCSVCHRRFRAAPQLRVHKCPGEKSWLHICDKPKKSLSCSECDATFPNNYLLMTHIRMHKGKKLFTCSVCGKKRQFSSHLEIHMRSHTGEKPYSCSVCGKRFSQRGILSQHMAIHSEVKPFSCSVCDRRFFWHFQVKKHKCLGESSQRRRSGLTGEDCGGPASSDPDGHLQPPETNKQTNPPPEPDDSADIEFWKDTRQHQPGFTYRRNKKAKTDDGVSGDVMRQMREPQSGPDHQNPEEVSVSDTGCNTEEKPFSCSEDSHTLLTHKRSPTGEKPFSCLSSGKGYVMRHTSVHTGEKPLSCIVCEKRFTLESQLLSHECVESLQLDSADRLSSSSRSGKGFNPKHQLQVPIRVHTGLKPFSCSVCGQTFAEHESLHSHMTCHTGEKPFHCSVCNAAFSDSEALVQHMRIHTRQTQFCCHICGEEFAWRRYLTKHMEVHSKQKPYSCRDCGQTFIWHYELIYHQCVDSSQLAEPPASSSTDGEDCGGPEPDSSDPDGHLQPPDTNKQTNPPPEPVDRADIEFWRDTRQHQSGFTYRRNKKVSVNNGYNPGEKPFSCSDDKAEPEVKTDDGVSGDVMRQMREPQSGPDHQNPEEVSVSDTGCNTEEKPFSCSEDGHTLLTHKRSPTGEKPFSCSVCGQTFAEHESFHSHMTCHTGEKPFHCSVCNAAFSDSEALVQHMRIHTRQTQFRCRICGEEFAWRRYLTKHMEVHSKEKPYSCRDCGQTFIWHYELIYHQCVDSSQLAEPPASSSTDGEDCGGPEPDRNSDPEPDPDDKTGDSSEPETDDSEDWKETREPQSGLNSLDNHEAPISESRCRARKKPFGCSQCDKRFGTKTNLKQHMRIHTGEKPFSCSVCGKRFLRKGYVAQHMLVHTGEKPFSCSVCNRSFTWPYQIKTHQCVGRHSSHLHQTEENREAEPPASSSTQHMETGGSGRSLQPATGDETGDSDEPESDDSDFWKEISGSLKHDETFNSNHPLKIHRRNHAGEEEFTERESLSQNTAKQEEPEPPEPPHIKEEQEELWSSQEGEQLQGLEEADITKFPFTPVPVKSEDDEEEPQSSQGEDCGGPGPHRNPDPDTHPEPETDDKTGDSSETETVESDDEFWKETREPRSGLSSLKTNEDIMGCDSGSKAASCRDVGTSECLESDDSVDSDFWKDNRKPPTGPNSLPKDTDDVFESEMGYDDLRKPHSCPECGKRFLHDYNMKNHMKYHTGEKAFPCSVCGLKCLYKSHLEIHMRTHTREKPFPCPVCGKKYAHKASMQSHMAVHSVEKQYSCSVCDEGFAWFTELKYHQCVGEATHGETM